MPDDELKKAMIEARLSKRDKDKPMTEDFWRNVFLKEPMLRGNMSIPDYEIPSEAYFQDYGTEDVMPDRYYQVPGGETDDTSPTSYYGPVIRGTQDAPARTNMHFYKHPENPRARI